MSLHCGIGQYYSKLLEEKLNSAIEQKLAATSSFKKSLAGIASIDDAKRKGYAPDNSQIEQMKDCIGKHADAKYALSAFRALSTDVAVAELLASITADINALNRQWQKERKFSFDDAALKDLTAEAREFIYREHVDIKKKLSQNA